MVIKPCFDFTHFHKDSRWETSKSVEWGYCKWRDPEKPGFPGLYRSCDYRWSKEDWCYGKRLVRSTYGSVLLPKMGFLHRALVVAPHVATQATTDTSRSSYMVVSQPGGTYLRLLTLTVLMKDMQKLKQESMEAAKAAKTTPSFQPRPSSPLLEWRFGIKPEMRRRAKWQIDPLVIY